MIRNAENTLMSVEHENELPENIRKYYDVINESDRIVSAFEYGKFHVCMKNEAGELGLFQKNLIKESGDMYLPSFENAPLFIRKPGKIVVIAPCEVRGGIRA
jgi:hypothetical protein